MPKTSLDKILDKLCRRHKTPMSAVARLRLVGELMDEWPGTSLESIEEDADNELAQRVAKRVCPKWAQEDSIVYFTDKKIPDGSGFGRVYAAHMPKGTGLRNLRFCVSGPEIGVIEDVRLNELRAATKEEIKKYQIQEANERMAKVEAEEEDDDA